ncbi:Tc toxin subunit A-related protein [Arundinibacter roseus]|uniref:Virulence plasmid A protein n=1 Tax=Arundinibacter roseus TaxID=2070510 RepID=A0A4R4KHJ0_9BACT|nr:neuraminidase-like domain-containing protein [Arundinibacter roseus]TDB67508.1 hypothetical protein EZE20_06070 [Arundinibacter roseus]
MPSDNQTIPYHVSGRVTDMSNFPLDQLLVRVFDRDLRSEELIGETVTNRDGWYNLDYFPENFLKDEKQYPDLDVKVFTRNGRQLLYEPTIKEIRFNARRREVIDIKLTRSIPREADEFTRYLGELDALRGDVPMYELDENEKVQDISFLTHETGISGERIEYLVLAYRLEAQFGLPPMVAYGLLRMETLIRRDMKDMLRARFTIGLDSDLQLLLFDLALLDEKRIQADLETAVTANYIPKNALEEYRKAKEILNKYRPEASDFDQKEKPRRVLNLLSGFILTDRISQVTELLNQSSGDMNAFFESLEENDLFTTNEDKNNAEVSLLLGSLLGYNEELTEEIKRVAGVRRPEDLKKLVQLEDSDWKAILGKVSGEGLNETNSLNQRIVDFHASRMVKNLEARFPSETYLRRLILDKNPMPRRKELGAFLMDHPDFDLKETRLDAYFKEHKLLDERDESVKVELKRHQRIFRLTPTYEIAKGLMDQNIHSSQGVVAVGKTRFINEVASKAGLTLAEAENVFAKAERTHTATLLVVADLNDMKVAAGIPALAGDQLALKLGKVGEDFPTLKNLFHLTDTCACEHCRSVYSPAAYLVELLQFLDKRRVKDTQPPITLTNAKDALFERRPDLGDLDLSCDNANVPVPYIDLVCEVLEEYISPDPGFNFNGQVAAGAPTNVLLTALLTSGFPVTDKANIFPPDVHGDFILRDKNLVLKLHNTGVNQWNIKELHQTYGTANELSASPYYVNENAYNVLKNSEYAFGLPFDLSHTEAKAYFDRFGIARAELMASLQSGSQPADIDLAAERLGLTKQQKDLVVTQAVGNQNVYWNTAGVASTEIKVVSTMLDKTGLTYRELNELLELDFMGANLFIKHLDESCDLSQKTIENLTAGVLDRIHRLLRLRKATGWSFQDLDAIIMTPALGNGNLDTACLINMGHLVEIKDKTGLKISELTGFYGDIPHTFTSNEKYVPLYQQVFLNKATNGEINPELLPEKIDGSTNLVTHKTSLSLALQLTEVDFDRLLAGMTNTDLSWANLSYLYASARFCSKRKISIKDYLIYKELTALEPFASPANTLQFIDYLDQAKNSTLSAADVKYMLHHESENLDLRSITDNKISEMLLQIQESYAAAYLANRSAFDDNLSVEELSGNLKTILLRLPGITQEIANDFVKMATGAWTEPPMPAASGFIDEYLDLFLDTTPIIAAQAAISPAEDNTDPQAGATKKAFIQSILDPLSAFLFATDKENALISILAESFRTEQDVVSSVLVYSELGQPGGDYLYDLLTDDSLVDLNDPENFPVVDETTYPKQYDSLRLLHKMLPMIASLGIPATDLTWWLESAGPTPVGMGWLQPDQIPYKNAQTAASYQQWLHLTGMVAVSKKYPALENPADPEQPFTFVGVLDLLLNGVSTADWLDQLAVISGYDRQALEELDAHFGWSNPTLESYKMLQTWDRLEESMEYIRKMNVTVAQALEVTKTELTGADAAMLRAALKTRYSESLWLITLKEIMDKIRPQKRDALVSYILAENADVTTTADLYDFYLIDVEMEACMPSSRIVQAHGVVQLFVQRCLMGLEPNTAADTVADPGWEQWKWMKMYRVWEANRKVFLYPENWIEPELLDDKSYLFSELENELLQNELNEFTTEEAIIRYVERLDDISFLEVMATYYETEAYTMHVFARSKGGDPPQYYYRRFESERYWTPWTMVPLEISSNQLLAFKRNSRLHLAWPVFTEETNEDQIPTTPAVSGSNNTPSSKLNIPEKRLKIQLAISQFANNQWKPKKISQSAITTDFTIYHSELNHEKYNLIYGPFTNTILVFHSSWDNNTEYHTRDGIFKIAGCQGYPELLDTQQKYMRDFLPDISDAYLRPQRYFEQGVFNSPDNLFILHLLSFFGLSERLNKTPGLFRISHPFQLNLFDIIGYVFMLLLSNVFRDGKGKERFVKLPFGTLFPYFFEDSHQAYVAVPGFYGKTKDASGNEMTVRRTFSDIHKLVMDLWALFVKYVQLFQANQDAAATFNALQIDPDFLHIVTELEVYKTLSIGEEWRNFYYPMMCRLRTVLYNQGVDGIMKRDLQMEQNDFNFNANYAPAPTLVTPYPVEDFDFRSDASYSSYNWELFYHTPLMIANRLRNDQKFDEAFRWYHYMFNPTGTLDGVVPNKYWVTKPFFQHTDSDYLAQRIDVLLYKVATPGTPEIAELEFAINQWREKPFRPHTVARFRPVAYQKTVLMNYLQALIDCGDYHFRMDTMESIVQATQYYMLAHKLLGPKPRVVSPVVKPPYQTYNQMEADLDAFGNALVELENLIPDLSTLPQGGAELPPVPETLTSLYFCIPLNEKMLGYWDTIDDRLWKIRNCRNLDGVERSLALFAPPIDPGALVKAAAAGLDIGSVIAGMNAPLPHYRFNVLAQKATELVQEVRSLGGALLQALEKKDAEAMSLLQNSLERKILKQMRSIKLLQIEESEQQIEVLNKTKETTQERHSYYASIEKIIDNEQLNLDKLSEGQDFQLAAQIVQATGAILGLIPDFNIGGHGAGGSPAFTASFGGSNLAEAANAAASVLNILSSQANYQANRASILGGYDRRWEDWKLQERTAALEIRQIDQQVVVAELTKQRNEKDLENHDIQIENNEKSEAFMRDKYTNKDLYQWMIGKISSVYFRAYQLAYDMAKKAEKSYQHELGNNDTFIDFGYWDSLKKGLLASDQLLHDVKRMEVAYLDKNKREYEITKHVSLDMLDPLALTRLRATGSCTFDIPEAVYDMDHPGHYFRRIKSVSISLPCIAGPYTSVSGKLSLVANKFRKNTDMAQGAATPIEEYQEDPGNDSRFAYNIGTIQSIATSSAQNDSGLFEFNFRDERYLPFEGTGAIGTWRFELPEMRQFDYQTIRDAIVHVRYTARDGGSTLRGLASSTLAEKLTGLAQELGKTGLHKAISLRHELPNVWHLFKTNGDALITLEKERLPYFTQPLAASISNVIFLARLEDNAASLTLQLDGDDLVLNRNDSWQMCIGETTEIDLNTQFQLTIDAGDRPKLVELLMVVKYEF